MQLGGTGLSGMTGPRRMAGLVLLISGTTVWPAGVSSGADGLAWFVPPAVYWTGSDSPGQHWQLLRFLALELCLPWKQRTTAFSQECLCREGTDRYPQTSRRHTLACPWTCPVLLSPWHTRQVLTWCLYPGCDGYYSASWRHTTWNRNSCSQPLDSQEVIPSGVPVQRKFQCLMHIWAVGHTTGTGAQLSLAKASWLRQLANSLKQPLWMAGWEVAG